MALVEVKVPDIGDFKDVEVIELLVKPGDTVKAEQSLITVESDKASMEIPSSHAGVIKELKIKLGDKVSEGSLLLLLESTAGAAAPAAAPVATPSAPAEAAAAPAAAAPVVAAAAPAAAGGLVDVLVPDIGDFADVTVIELLVKPGDRIAVEQSLITVESDKASMEIPSSQAGVLKELKVKLGDKVSKGSLVAVLQGVGGAVAATPATVAPAPVAAEPASAPAAAPAAATAAMPAHQPASPSATLPHASPSVRKFARELGVPLDQVKGSGPKGRITQADVQGFVKGVMAGSTAVSPAPTSAGGGVQLGGLSLLPWPQVDFAKFGPIETKPLSRIQKISGANLARNWAMIPHVTQFDEADITDLEALRVQLNKENEKSGVKLTMLAFLIKAMVVALKKYPAFNASLDGDNLVMKQYFHIGFAADTPNGLVVPVLKNADGKGVLEIASESSAMAKKARDGKLGPAEMQGGCISISSLGGIGGTAFTPIINAPEVAILGVSKSEIKPKWNGREFEPRLMLPLSLSYDHRVIDGALAARFTAFLGQLLADMRRTLL